MAQIQTSSYSIPTNILKYVEELGYQTAYGDIESYIQEWNTMLRCQGSFWDFQTSDGTGKQRTVHRATVKPAKRVCREFASLIMDGDMRITASNEVVNEWLQKELAAKKFVSKGQKLVRKAFGLGTGAFVLWLDLDAKKTQVRRFDARMILPLSWDEDGIYECAFVTRAQAGGKAVDQLQMHVVGENGNYEIRTLFFDCENGQRVVVEGVEETFDTKSDIPWFGIFIAEESDIVDFSPYGQSVFADSIDVLKSVDVAYDAEFGEVKNGKRILFLSDSMLQIGMTKDGKRTVRAFTTDESGIYRMVDSVDDMVKDFAPALRVDGFSTAYRDALATMGDSLGFGTDYFTPDKSGGIKTAKEVAAGNSQLMRTIAKYEESVGCAITDIVKAMVYCQATFIGGLPMPQDLEIKVQFDDSIIEDTDSEKAMDMAEVSAGIMPKYLYLMKWHGLEEQEARQWVQDASTVVETMPSFGE